MQHDHGLSRQAVAARSLLDGLRGEVEIDVDFAHDLVEGETDFFEAVQRVLDEISECEIVCAGVSDMKKRLTDRETRTKNRMDRLRGLLDQAFQMAEIQSHKFPTATVTLRAIAPKAIVKDEAAIPSKFFEPQPPKLNMKNLLAALKDGPVPGADLSNGGQSIQIRRA